MITPLTSGLAATIIKLEFNCYDTWIHSRNKRMRRYAIKCLTEALVTHERDIDGRKLWRSPKNK